MIKSTDARARYARLASKVTAKAELLALTDQMLNTVAAEVADSEVGSSLIQDVINRMLELSAGKGHSKNDSRQMVGLAAPQLGFSKRVITIDITADGSNKAQH